MIRNYFIIAWRSLLKNKLFSFINITGLALSMSIGVLELIRISDAFDYDNFHVNSQNIYRIQSQISTLQGDNMMFASSPLPLKEAVSKDNHSATLIYPDIHATLKDNSRAFDCDGVFIEPSFFEMFNFRLLYGEITSMNEPHRVLLSEQFSKKFFGSNNPLGKIVTIGNLGEFEISGVIQTPPAKSHIQYDVFVSLASAAQDKLQDWNTFKSGYTYVRLGYENEKSILDHELHVLANKLNASNSESRLEFELQPLSSISPQPSDIYNDIGGSPSRGSLMAEMLIVLVVLIAACFNYTNLSIARALTRGKEIGVRKLSGATRFQIISQYVMEAVLISLLALVVANFIVAPIIEFQPFNDGYEMIPTLTLTWRFVGFVLTFTLLTGLMAGILPAWLLSSFKPVRILKGVATEKLMGHMSLRKALLVFQFSLSLVVLVFLSIFYQQFDFLSHADPGFNREGVLLVPGGMHSGVTAASFNNIAGVRSTGFTSGKFGNKMSVAVSRQVHDANASTIDYYACDKGWIDLMDLKVVAGTIDLGNSSKVVLNEKSIAALGFADVDEATGSRVYLNDSTTATISGVVSDFYADGYGNAVKPILFRGDSGSFKMIAVQVDRSGPNLVVDLEHQWLQQNAGHSFDYVWIDPQMADDKGQNATVSLLGFLGLITISIATLGLLGLVVYTVEVKRKEISIRKIIGATVNHLVALLSKGFLTLLCVAGLIALPIGYLMGQLFLMNFVNHISIGWFQLFGSFGLLLLIGLITILSQTIGAASENPSKNLRSE